MKKLFALVAVAALGLSVNAQEKAPFKATCPMSGGAAKQDHAVDFQGKKVYFCCEKCPEAFKKDPAKVAAKVYLQLLETKQAIQVACPLSGHDIDGTVVCTIGNAKVQVCCEDCQSKIKDASADEKIALAFGKPDKAYTLQAVCPVSGKDIKTSVSVEHEGKKVYFCCPGCPDAFKKDPAKFVEKLPQFQKK
jgi:YHS domain-containing protein